jgi:uncharacterized delta-60 repeat protein
VLSGGLPVGSLDPGFNADGWVTSQLGAADAGGAGAVQRDGSVVVAGSVTGSDGSQTIAVVRYRPDGTLDPTFNQTGINILNPADEIIAAAAVFVIDDYGRPDDGQIIVVGTSRNPNTKETEVALAGFNSDGSLNRAGFGVGGIASDPGVPNAQAVTAVLLLNNEIVVAGEENLRTGTGTVEDPFVERFFETGQPDRIFFAGGPANPLFGGASGTIAGVAHARPSGDTIVAGKITTGAGTSLIGVVRLTPDGFLDPSFGSGGIVTIDPGDAAGVASVDGVAMGPQQSIVVAATGAPTASAPGEFLVVRLDFNGNLDPAFNHQQVKAIGFGQGGQGSADSVSAIAVQPDGSVVIAGTTASPVAGRPGSFGPEEIAMTRLNPDGTLDPIFGERGQVITDLSATGRAIQGVPRSVLVQPDGHIVVTGTAFDTETGQALSAFAVARYVGFAAPGSGATPASNLPYVEDFASDADPTLAGFDTSGVFQHTFWVGFQPVPQPPAVAGPGWDLENAPGVRGFALHLQGAVDAVTFPDLRPDVHVTFVAVDVLPSAAEAKVIFVGANGAYEMDLPRSGSVQTASAGEAHVLQGDVLNPTLELGPIREVILDSPGAAFANLRALVVPGQGPLDISLTVRPHGETAIDLLAYATKAAEAGLQPPLGLQATSQPAHAFVWSTTNPGVVLYEPAAGLANHVTDSFTYTVVDANGKLATGAVDVTLNTPPVISVYLSPYTTPGDVWMLPHGTPGPLTGDILLSDAEGDPVTMALLGPPGLYGHVTLTEVTPTHYRYEYDPPAIIAYDSRTGLTRTVSNLVGDDQFTLEAGDGFDVTDVTVQFSVSNNPPVAPDESFIVPENTGVTYYSTNPSDPHYDASLAHPGLVHFDAPGVLWDATDMDGDPLMALFPDYGDPLMASPDPANLPHHGKVELFPDGSFNYTPDPGFIGQDSFGFFASDGYLLSSTPDPSSPSGSRGALAVIQVGPGVHSQPPRMSPVLHDEYDLIYSNLDAPGVGEPSPWSLGQDTIVNSDPARYRLIMIRPVNPLEGQLDANNVFHPTLNRSIEVQAQYDISGVLTAIVLTSPDQGWSYTLDAPTIFDSAPTSQDQFEIQFKYAYIDVTGDPSGGSLSNIATFHLVIDKKTNRAALYLSGSHSEEAILESPPGTRLDNVQLISPTPPGAPSGVVVPWLISFAVEFPPYYPYNSGTPLEVTITLPPGTPHFTTYYKFGLQSSPDGMPSQESWYPFMYDPAHGHPTGAELSTDASGQQIITLHLIKGALGDSSDMSGAAEIDDPGGPGYYTDPARNFVAGLYEDVLGRGPSDAEMARWVKALDRGESRRKVARAVWDSAEHRRLQVDAWSSRFLSHAADPRQQARWITLLRRGRGEIAVEQAILTSPDYRRAHPTLASFLAGLDQDVLGLAGDPVEPSRGRLGGHRERASFAAVAHRFLTSAAAAGVLAQQDATTLLGRPATAQERRAEGRGLRSGSAAPGLIAERILASQAFYDFVNSALPTGVNPSRPDRNPHHPARHPRGR